MTTDVEDEGDVRVDVVSSLKVCHGLDDAVVEVERGLDEIFAISSYARAFECGSCVIFLKKFEE